jgi:acetyltransferase-like isoleucine patch superfamily enzyme
MIMADQPRRYNLNEIYGDESIPRRYIRIAVGENRNLWDLFIYELITGVCRGFPGIIGYVLRNRLYPLAFKSFHKRSFIGCDVTLRCPHQIHLSRGVIVDDFAQLLATSRHPEAIKIGESYFVRSFAMINAGPPEGYVHVGRNTGIGQGVLIYGNGGLTIGENVMIAGGSSIIASSHIVEDSDIPMIKQGYIAKGITIQDNVWIGTGVRILDGVTIGTGAIVGANAVVNRSVQPGDKVGGIPARSLIKQGFHNEA